MFAGITDVAVGLITNAGYDFFKNKLAEGLRPNFQKIYDESIKELCKQHPKAKNYIKRFLKSNIVKNIALDPKLPRRDKIAKIASVGEQIKKSSEEKIDARKVITDFYEIFKEKIRLNPNLWVKIEEEYLTKIAELSIATNQKIDLLSENLSTKHKEVIEQIKNTRKDILKQIEDKAEFKYIKRSVPFPLLICAVQFVVERTSLNEISNNIDNFPFSSKEDISLLVSEENKKSWQYLPKKENNVIKLTHRDMPYKIIYPPFNKIEIIAETIKGKDLILITIFSTERRQIARLKHIIFGSIAQNRIKEVSFKERMKTIAKKFLPDLTVFDYDPLIYKPVRVKGIEIKEKANRAIMFGERGFLRRPELRQVVNKVKMEREKQLTDIFFLKMLDTTKLSEDPITLEIRYRGDVAGFFPRNKFTDSQAKKIVCGFFEKFGNFD